VTSPLPGSSPQRRRAPVSRLRRTSEVVLVSGTVLALLSVIGPGWAPRAGVVVAVAAALVACFCAWRELFHAERAHARSVLELLRRHGHQLREERTRNAEVVEALTGRVQAAGRTIDGQSVTIAGLRQSVTALEGDRIVLRRTLGDRDRTIAALRTTVQRQDVELVALRTDLASLQADLEAPAESGEVHHLPRRSARAELDALTAGEASAVVDLRTLETVRGVLPNYEADRRRA
jgi:hypothetical protein